VIRTCALAGLLAALFISGAALAQTVVGRSIVDGKVALLYDNNTWTYEDAGDGNTGCTNVTPRVQFCGESLGWRSSPPGSTEINAAYQIDAAHYAQYLIEDLGTDNGFNAEFMRRAVLDNASSFAGSDAEVIDVQPATLGDLSGETIVYRTNVNGVDVVFANAVFVDTTLTMQIMTYAIAASYTPEHAKMQADLLANTKVLP
jgi:hypothetical protein